MVAGLVEAGAAAGVGDPGYSSSLAWVVAGLAEAGDFGESVDLARLDFRQAACGGSGASGTVGI